MEKMQKHLIAAAVASALGIPAEALAQSTVQVFGTIDLEYGYADQGTGTNGPRNNVDLMQISFAEIGFRGEEKLGGGLSAWFQCASTADIRGQAPQGFCSRNSAIGFKGAFGSVFIGRWDTPFKRTMIPNELGIGSEVTGLSGSSFLLVGGSTSTLDGNLRAVFQRRQANTVNYDSPTFGGFQVLAAFSTTNGATASTTAATGAKPRIWSLGAQYSVGPLYISGAYERHNQFGATGGDDSGWHIGGNYTFMGRLKAGVFYTQQKFQITPTTESKVKAWLIGADWKFSGPHSIRASYTKADDISGNAAGPGAAVAGSNAVRPAPGPETGAELWSINYVYTFSKRTEARLGYARLDNDANAAYTLGGLSNAANGTNQDAWILAVRHRF